MNDYIHKISDEIIVNLSNQEQFEQAALIRLFTHCKEYSINSSDFMNYLSLIGFPQLKCNADLLLKELNENTSKIKLILNDENEKFDINNFFLNLSFESDLAIIEIYKILSNSERISDLHGLIRITNELEFLFINLNVNLGNYFIRKAQVENVFDFKNSYFPSFAYQEVLKTIKTLSLFYLNIKKSNPPELYLKDSVEQLKCIADFLFLTKSIVDISNFPLIKNIEKLAFNKILDFFLIHLQDASIHRIIVQRKPVPVDTEPNQRKAVDNTTRIILFYQMKNQYSYKLRIDLPHVEVEFPHINFSFLNKEMVGPIPKQIAKKYESSGVTYKDVCDEKYYFDPTKKCIDDEIKTQIKKYRHKNLLVTDSEDIVGLDKIFDNLISYLYLNDFFSRETSHYIDDTRDPEIFNMMKKRGLASLLSCLTFQGIDTKPIIKELIIAFPKHELEELSKDELLEFLQGEIYDS